MVPVEMVGIVMEVASEDTHTDFEVANTLEGSAGQSNLVDFESVHTPADSVDGMAEDDTNTLVEEVEAVEEVEENNYMYWIKALRVFELVEGSEGEVCFRS